MHTENEITAWLEPLFQAAESTDIDLWAIVQRARVPLGDGSEPKTEHRSDGEAVGEWPDLSTDEARMAVDWVCFGQLLRHELGWDASYPEDPAVVREHLRRKRDLVRHQIREQITDLEPGGLA
jgi:hypothetical protein